MSNVRDIRPKRKLDEVGLTPMSPEVTKALLFLNEIRYSGIQDWPTECGRKLVTELTLDDALWFFRNSETF
jgi:hypothetical protein